VCFKTVLPALCATYLCFFCFPFGYFIEIKKISHWFYETRLTMLARRRLPKREESLALSVAVEKAVFARLARAAQRSGFPRKWLCVRYKRDFSVLKQHHRTPKYLPK